MLDHVVIIDNFLPKKYYEFIENEMNSKFFTWTFRPNITFSDGHNNLGAFGFNHSVYYKDEIYSPMHDILQGFYGLVQSTFECSSVIKCRFDMTVYNPNKHIHDPHIDVDNDSNITTILYLTDSTSPTIIYNERSDISGEFEIMNLSIKEEVLPQKNRLVAFDGHQIHTGHSPQNEKFRACINTNFRY